MIQKSLFIAVYCLLLGPALATAADDKKPKDNSAELIQLAIGLFGDKDKDIRALGFEQVRTDAPGEAATRAFAAELPKLSAEAQVGLLSALADRGDAAARPAVLKLLASKLDEPVKIAVLAALGKLGTAEDVTLLVFALNEASESVKSTAKASLVTLPGEATPAAIVTTMKNLSPELQVTLIDVLATRRALTVLPALLELATNKEPTIRAAAMIALGKLAGPDQVAGMATGVLKAEQGSEREAAEKALVLAAARTEDPEQRAKPLLAVLAKSSEAEQLALLPTLGRLGGKEALQRIRAELAHSDAPHHAAGVSALGSWPDASVIATVFELAKTDPKPELRVIALSSLIRLGPMTDGRADDVRLATTKQVMDLCKSDEDQNRLLRRIQNIRTPETLQYVLPFLKKPENAQAACEAIVEMAHHRGLREPNKPAFDAALDQVIATSKDPVVIDRAQRYKKDQTWVRPAKAE